MIKVDDVTKVYEQTRKIGWFKKVKENKVAVNRLTLDLHPGEIVGLLGLNGAGKTTTIKMLSTLLAPTSGTITIDGEDIEGNRRAIQSKINMIAGGERMLYWRLTGRENLHYFGRMYGLSEAVTMSRSEALLEEVGLSDAVDIPVEKYSKGMKQRLQIARGLMNDPKYLFLDEPTLGLDAPIARHLRKMVKELAVKKGKGILLTSHYLQEVEELCDRVYVINRGQLMLAGTTQDIVRQTSGDQIVQIQVERWREEIQSAMSLEMRLPMEAISVDPQSDDGSGTRLIIKTNSADLLVPRLLTWLVERGMNITGLSTEKPTLEDAIIRLSEGVEQDERILANA
ncbi:ABC transporter ATP-binding protein [Paenibacillus sp. GP183]|jgi:ABC-2 type transport system ATP-binding protein|uniref:ABC transporter ATP-binding protein n=1 Tax=Paenibacillus sp. GP183 TaxID=1882751 RepID=UPI00089B8F9C|nr:ABC transporter ATP-binding protein [Paenibacillus sp. GP183]SEC28325.1 ABC-2 type transport system ATP-binding protein [Paenibacillus sp. GP183]